MLKAIILTAAVAVALVVYFSLSLYVFPQSYQSIEARRPQAIVTDVSLSAPDIALGQALTISITGSNNGEDADMQIVSVGFPNLTTTDNIKIVKHDFDQTPILIAPGELLSSEYSDTDSSVLAQYTSIEAFSRPWEAGKTYTADIEVIPKTEGKFVVFIKSVALPHTWEQAHYPQDGILDQQKEFVETYSAQVTKP
ncbi:MAG: hypothetical protein M3M89_03755 [Thermoproteota archaeon]|nr:hypothetical protein [Thermoproteota archaeon]